MAPELEMGGGLGLGMGLLDLGFPHGMMMEAFSTSSSSSAPYASSCGSAVGDASYLYGLLPTPDSSTAIAAFHQVDDLLDFSAKEGLFEAPPVDVGSYAYHNGNVQASQHHLVPSHQHPPFHSAYGAATPNYGIFTADHHSSSSAGSDLAAFPDDLYIPSEEAAELEWLSKFVDDSSDVPFHIPGITTAGGTGYASPAAANSNTNQYSSDGTAAADGTLITRADTSGELMIPGRARSKRPRVATSMGATDCTPWLSNSHLPSPSSSSCSSSETKQPRISLNGGKRKRVAEEAPGIGASAERGAAAVMRRCTHCSSEKTPQWRTGPLGPKTLCNACGVRYKSGRLVPEYRPASSPTFVLTQHSNSHRKVMELRRQKEMVMRHHHHQDASPSGLSLVSVSPSPSAVLASTRPDLLLRDFQVC